MHHEKFATLTVNKATNKIWADKFDPLVTILLTFCPPIQAGFLRAMFVNHI